MGGPRRAPVAASQICTVPSFEPVATSLPSWLRSADQDWRIQDRRTARRRLWAATILSFASNPDIHAWAPCDRGSLLPPSTNKQCISGPDFSSRYPGLLPPTTARGPCAPGCSLSMRRCRYGAPIASAITVQRRRSGVACFDSCSRRPRETPLRGCQGRFYLPDARSLQAAAEEEQTSGLPCSSRERSSSAFAQVKGEPAFIAFLHGLDETVMRKLVPGGSGALFPRTRCASISPG